MGSWFRVITVSFVVALYAVRYALGRVGTFFIRDRERRREATSMVRGRVLRAAMERLGATFIKLGQVMSARPDLFDREVIRELRKLQDQIPSFPFSEVELTVVEDLGGEVSDHFAEIDPEPVAAASVAQVHRALLGDGTEVAVKILRPNIRETVERDAKVMIAFGKIMHLSPKARSSDMVGHIQHFVRGIIEQTDLTIEAKNYDRFRKNFAGHDGVIFPRVYADRSSRRILTMQFVRGTKADELPADEDHTELVERLRNGMFKMLFVDGFLHCDLHPGNFVVTDDRKVAIFDVGLCKELSDDLLIQFIDWNRCLVMGGAEDHVRHMKTYYLRDRDDIDWDELVRSVEEFTASFRGKTQAEIELSELVDGAFALGRKYGLRPVTEMTLIMVGVVTADGVGKQLDADTDSLQAIAEFLMPILAERGMLGEASGGAVT